MKTKMDTDKIAQFLGLHGEKLALVGVVLGTLYLVYASYSLKGIDSNRSPDALARKANEAQQHIQQSDWQSVSATRVEDEERFDVLAKQQVTIDLAKSDYHLNAPWNPLNFVPERRRSDPRILAVQDLRVNLVVATAAEQQLTSPEMAATAEKKDDGKGGISLKSDAGVAGGYQTQENEWDDKGKLVKRPLPEQIRSRLGTQAVGVGGGGVKTQGVRAALLTGLVPFREQVKLFQENFMGTRGAVVERDFPNYIDFYVERAEVRPGGKLGEWKRIETREMYEKQHSWGQTMDSFVPESRMNPSLTFPLPNLLFESLENLARHPGIPTPDEVSEEEIEKQLKADGEAFEKAKKKGPGWNPMGGDAPTAVTPGGGTSFTRMGLDNEGGRFMRGGMVRGMMDEDDGFGMMMMGRRRPMGGDPDGPGGGGMMMGGSFGVITDFTHMKLEDIPEYLMLRFFDYTVQPGHSYQYRVSLLLMDPNNPEIQGGPDPRFLEDDVTNRLRENKKKVTADIPFVFWMEGPWSDPSPTFYTDTGYQLFAGPVTLNKDVPRTTIMALKMDPAEGKAIPWKSPPYHRGAIVGSKAPLDLWVLNPSDMTLDWATKVEFRTSLQVADIRGGERLGTSLNAPGEVLIIAEDGRMAVQSELDDADKYFIHDFPPPDPNLEPPEDSMEPDETRGQGRPRRPTAR